MSSFGRYLHISQSKLFNFSLSHTGNILFGFILKGLCFMFLDEIAVTLSSKPKNKITASDIESAARRVGVNTLLSPITDQFFLIYILIFVLMIFSLGFPFFIFWIF